MDRFDLTLAVKLASLSEAVYYSSDSFVERKRELGLKDYSYRFLEKDGTQCYVVYSIDDKVIYIVWRGTEISDKKDLLANLRCKKVSLNPIAKVHRGFKYYVDNVYFEIKKCVQEIILKGGWFDIYLTGHSLGAACALISTNRLEEDGIIIKFCYTYGSPRVGGRNFNVKTPVWRVRNNNDIVTKFPLPITGFKHTGSLCYISQRKRLFIGKRSHCFLFVDWARGHFSRMFDGVRDHSINEYYRILKSILDTGRLQDLSGRRFLPTK